MGACHDQGRLRAVLEDGSGLAKYINLGSLDEQGVYLGGEKDDAKELADYQLQQAAALRKPGPQYNTPVAAGLGGLATVLNGLNSTMRERDALGERDKALNDIRARQADIIRQKNEGRKGFADAMGSTLKDLYGPKPVDPTSVDTTGAPELTFDDSEGEVFQAPEDPRKKRAAKFGLPSLRLFDWG